VGPTWQRRGARARLPVAAAEGRGAWLLGCSAVGRESSWAAREKKRKGRKGAGRGEGRSSAFGLKPEGRALLFLFSVSLFF